MFSLVKDKIKCLDCSVDDVTFLKHTDPITKLTTRLMTQYTGHTDPCNGSLLIRPDSVLSTE